MKKAEAKAPVVVQPPTPPAPAAPPPSPPAPVPPSPAPVDPNAEYIKGLTEAQRDELKFAEYVEAKYPEQKGKAAEVLAYFKKTDDFVAKHPDLTPDSDEFKEFLEKNRPKYGDRHKLEMQRVKDEATEEATRKAKAETEKEIAALKRKTYEMEIRPKVEKANQQFRDALASGEVKAPEGIESTGTDVAKRINEVGYEKAAEEFPVEAPIVQSAYNAAQEYLHIMNGLTSVNLENPTHAWLADFIAAQGNILARQPAEKKTRVFTEKGQKVTKTFLPRAEYSELVKADATAAQKHWTFSHEQILDMIAVNALIGSDLEVKKLEKAGFKREKKSAKPESAGARPPEAGPSPAPAPSPKAGKTTIPGAATGAGNVHPNASFLEALVPGASKLLK